MIPFYNLGNSNALLLDRYIPELVNIVKGGKYINGDIVKQFENHFSSMSGAGFALAVGNGYDALLISFKALVEKGVISKGDRIIVPANTYIASIIPVIEAGLVPVFMEPDLATFNISPQNIEENFSPDIKAILVVHLYGRCCDMNRITNIANKYDLVVVEDACQAHFSSYNKKFAGSFGQLGCFSFFPGKNLGAFGDAGMITSSDNDLITTARSIANYGELTYSPTEERKYENHFIGRNSRMDEIQAAVLLLKIQSAIQDVDRRRFIASKYLENIVNDRVALPVFDDDVYRSSWHLFVLRVEDRQGFIDHMTLSGIQTMVHYPIPPHKQLALKNYVQPRGDFPITSEIHRTCVSIPLRPDMTDTEITSVVNAVNDYF
jgi:dTDP-4-amino-4,6-dideoxygalactose transaminase